MFFAGFSPLTAVHEGFLPGLGPTTTKEEEPKNAPPPSSTQGRQSVAAMLFPPCYDGFSTMGARSLWYWAGWFSGPDRRVLGTPGENWALLSFLSLEKAKRRRERYSAGEASGRRKWTDAVWKKKLGPRPPDSGRCQCCRYPARVSCCCRSRCPGSLKELNRRLRGEWRSLRPWTPSGRIRRTTRLFLRLPCHPERKEIKVVVEFSVGFLMIGVSLSRFGRRIEGLASLCRGWVLLQVASPPITIMNNQGEMEVWPRVCFVHQLQKSLGGLWKLCFNRANTWAFLLQEFCMPSR